MRRINFLKSLLVVQTLGLMIYTWLVFESHGINLWTQFMNQVAAYNWPGQFNLDFLCYLLLSGLWIMWRAHFTPKSIFIGLLAMVLGILFFAPYVLWLLQREKGDLKKVLVGRS